MILLWSNIYWPEGVTKREPTHHDAAPAICGRTKEGETTGGKRWRSSGGRGEGRRRRPRCARPRNNDDEDGMMMGILIWARTDAGGVAFLARGGQRHNMRISIGGQVSHSGYIHIGRQQNHCIFDPPPCPVKSLICQKIPHFWV